MYFMITKQTLCHGVVCSIDIGDVIDEPRCLLYNQTDSTCAVMSVHMAQMLCAHVLLLINVIWIALLDQTPFCCACIMTDWIITVHKIFLAVQKGWEGKAATLSMDNKLFGCNHYHISLSTEMRPHNAALIRCRHKSGMESSCRCLSSTFSYNGITHPVGR